MDYSKAQPGLAQPAARGPRGRRPGGRRTTWSIQAAAAAAMLLGACGADDPGLARDAPAAAPPAALAGSAPYSGTPIALPAIFEAENFDLGGEDVGYHDLGAGNAGRLYRTKEDVDIIASTDPAGGAYVVNNFQAGEWLAYTVNVAAGGSYDIDLRVSSAFSSSAYHVEIDGNNVTGRVGVPDTGGWSSFRWIGRKGVPIAFGRHTLKVVAEDEYFNLNSVRVLAAPGSTPYSGTPITLPGVFEAENFDRGGEGVAYHDKVAGNAGGQYRTSEDVDIVVSSDPAGGGFVVDNFETGEWLAYTVLVAAAGSYDVAVRASSAFTGSALHVEIDGRDVTGPMSVPNTGSWSTFQWVGKSGVTLSAGRHVLKIVADQQYFNLNQVMVRAASAPASSGAKALFRSGFEGAVALDGLLMFGNGAWQDITGTDSETGFAWPPRLWGGSGRLQFIAGDNVSVLLTTLPGYMYNEIQTVTGRTGAASRALYSTVLTSVAGATVNWNSTQNDFVLFPGASGQGDLYVSYWLQFQPDLLQRMTVNNWAGRVVSDWKTGSATGGGDYRIVLNVYGDGANKRLYWQIQGDNVANGGLPQQVYWQLTNTAIPVPVGRWFRIEVFVHRSGGADGRVWVAVDGQKLFDRVGANLGVYALPWHRIMPFLNYSSGQSLPAYQWVDDFEIWDGFPATASAH